MLVDDDVDQQAETDGDMRHAMFGCRARAAKGHHMGGDGARARRCPSHDDAPAMGVENGGAQLRAADHRREAKLIATRHEDSGRVFQGVDGLGMVRLFAGFRPHTGHFDDPDPAKDMAIKVGRRIAEGGRGADDPNVSLGAAGELDEA